MDEKLSLIELIALLNENQKVVARNCELLSEKNIFESLVNHLSHCFGLSSNSREMFLGQPLQGASLSLDQFQKQQLLVSTLLEKNVTLWENFKANHQDFGRALYERNLVLDYLNSVHELNQTLVSQTPQTSEVLENYVEIHRIKQVLEHCNQTLEKKLDSNLGLLSPGFVFPFECHLKTFAITKTFEKTMQNNELFRKRALDFHYENRDKFSFSNVHAFQENVSRGLSGSDIGRLLANAGARSRLESGSSQVQKLERVQLDDEKGFAIGYIGKPQDRRMVRTSLSRKRREKTFEIECKKESANLYSKFFFQCDVLEFNKVLILDLEQVFSQLKRTRYSAPLFDWFNNYVKLIQEKELKDFND